ncbi:MAG TPA: mitofilin family membrane protein [Stellaceae bacterium]|nr:mitofilin family membrane protein [Stellaceae bacterium]
MSEPRENPEPVGEAVASEPEAAKPAVPYRALALGLAGALVLVVALVASAPSWVPALPWGGGAPADNGALAARLDRLAAAQRQLDRRIGALEARPATPGDAADLRAQLTKLSSAVADQATRLAAIDKAASAQAAAAGELTGRLDAIAKAASAQAAKDTSDTALVLVLLQIRDAVAAGRPFTAEYDALSDLAHSRADVAAAAAPLAAPATTGVASRAVLAETLRALAGTIAAAQKPPVAAGWAAATLARLRGLVRIRRIDAAAPAGTPDAVVTAAERALAGGDLAAAVEALDKLTGAPQAAARPWLRLAQQRLAVEAALHRIETLVSARLGAAALPPASSGPAR